MIHMHRNLSLLGGQGVTVRHVWRLILGEIHDFEDRNPDIYEQKNSLHR